MHYYKFLSPTILIVSGKDSRRYLNARLTCNIKEIKIGESLTGAQLSSTGKCQGIFDCLCLEEQKFLLVSSYGDSSFLIDALKQFIVADRVDILNLSAEYDLFHIAQAAGDIKSFAEYAYPKDRGYPDSIDLVSTKKQSDDILQYLEKESYSRLIEDQLSVQRAISGKPTYPLELNENTLFSEANLKEMISFTKGCYVGQEVIERIEAMGKTAWKILGAKFSKKIDNGAEIFLSAPEASTKAGTVISCYFNSVTGEHLGFVRIKNISDIESAQLTCQEAKVELYRN